MKITKAQLKKLIREELEALDEAFGSDPGSYPSQGGISGLRPGFGKAASGSPGFAGGPSHDPGQVAEDPAEVEEVAAMLKSIDRGVLQSALDLVGLGS